MDDTASLRPHPTPHHNAHTCVVYQIYPKSFADSTGNGVGDLRGIIAKVPYIASLGVDLVWLNPFFPSPGRDNGYDVSDYCAIDPTMGTLDDFDELVAALADHGIGVMLDMVLNHSSTAHEWFQRALAGEQCYRDYYILRPAKPDGSLPTNWESKFGGPSWSRFGTTDEYYLHLFDHTQADLNWRNPAVREEMARIVNFWRDRGVQGFRFDVINLIGKDAELRDGPDGEDPRWMYTDGVDVLPYLTELAARSYGQDPDTITVGEMSSTSIERCIAYTHPETGALDMVFNFHHLKVDYDGASKWTHKPYEPAALKAVLHEWAHGLQAGQGWPALFLNNHDQPRALDRFGDVGAHREAAATMLATLTHLGRGTPYIYMGEEIGMTDPEYTSIDDYVDVEARNGYEALLAAGTTPDRAFALVHAKARDNARTPMQWDDSPHGGFTAGTPWLRPTNHDRISVAAEQRSGRIMPYYQQLCALRKTHPVIAAGSYEIYDQEHPQVYAFFRSHDRTQLLVICNLSGAQVEFTLPEHYAGGAILIANRRRDDEGVTLSLQPFDALVVVRP